MRTYEAQCRLCGYFTEYRRHVKDCLDTPDCPQCEYKMEKIIKTAPRGFVKNRWSEYRSPVDGSLIRNQHDLEEHNKRNNVVPMAEGYTTEQLMKMRGDPPPRDGVQAADVAEAYRAVKEGYKPTPVPEIDL